MNLLLTKKDSTMTATVLPFVAPRHTAIMALRSHVPDSAMTAGLLGTEREGHAVQVREDGLLLTVGYLIMEAREVWLTNSKGQTAEGIVLAQDYDSGLALLKPAQALGRHYLESAPLASITEGDSVSIHSSADTKPFPAHVVSKQEFAGRWEYLLDEAIYTAPLYEHWSGAALLNPEGKLCGIGSLALGLGTQAGKTVAGNLFIPTELVIPHLEHMSLYGNKPGTLRPWLGILVDEQDAELVVIGLYAGSPAARAGIRPGDVILSVDRNPVNSLPGFLRTLWHYGPAGTEIPLLLRKDDKTREVRLHTIDRNTFFIYHGVSMLN